ncbi:hypothetical protein IWW57_001181 [Coemansia sp. S610]|uniref:Uncharacterized protein n=1 Tax=Coemansia linderi TaxID=2663919 RepID=A0ACC1JWK3_9FUNG|nr:hypothetical protein GGI06_001177 [Coemansia sp. S85]KAJ2030444.1 hypothetical protein IWW57_001181 [Coemansia sp. S610]KAJ2400339.1 hypothetical protein GGI10_006240 [Coemansia sp. RSA 2530]KAJ2698966.1 hypothetical protein H4218_002953 [Coemansia sp. IMI 209128]KAJ2768759.1 hypothetical protein GGI18_005528 [Coemansia linderi]
MFTTPLRLSARSIKHALAPARPSFRMLKLAPVPGMRMHTKVDIYTESSAELNPIELLKYLQSNKERELREFLTDESEMVASESFNVDPDVSFSKSPNTKHGNKAVNEEFAKQIHDLLNPSYGSA